MRTDLKENFYSNTVGTSLQPTIPDRWVYLLILR